MKSIIAIASAALIAGIASTPAAADTLSVQGTVAPYCNVSLANVSSGTASIAMANTQTIANLRLACNAASGTKFVLQTKNGDLLQQAGAMQYRINYDLIVDSPSDSSFSVAAHDTFPEATNIEDRNQFTRNKAGYDQAVATGIPLILSLNMNVAADTNNTPTSRNFSANAAPAGTYTEVFTFIATSV
jgi:hypothetical protein